jgi:ribosome-binding protein aMBF1 (putative translation factor)
MSIRSKAAPSPAQSKEGGSKSSTMPRQPVQADASEAELMEIKLGLARRLRELRAQHSWTQADLAARLGSSQSRVAKMEAADSTVSVDLLVRSLLTARADRKDVGRAVGLRRR